MESEIRGEFQCVVRFVLGKPFSGPGGTGRDGGRHRDRGRRRARRARRKFGELVVVLFILRLF